MLPLRELIALARQRLGPAASALKTRAEFLAALTTGTGPASASVATAPVPSARPPASAPRPPATRPAVVTRDFFVARRA